MKESLFSAPFRLRRLGHANYFVTDLDRTMEFYKKVAGFEEVYRKASSAAADASVIAGFLSNGNTHHDIAVVVRRQDPKLNHFGFELENEVDLIAWYRQATETGVKFRANDHTIARSLYLWDPDGNGTEVYADITRDWRGLRGDGRIVREIESHWTPGDPPRFTAADAHNYHEDPEIRWVEDAIFHPKRIAHAVVVANDYEGLYRYYTSLVGLLPIYGGPNDRLTVLSGTTGGRQLTLFRGTGRQPTGLHHFGFQVWDEEGLERSEQKLSKEGMKPEFVIDHASRRGVFLRDPDGLLIEFYVDR